MKNKIIIEVLEPGTNKFKTLMFEKNEIVIGRSYDCDVVINDKFIDEKQTKVSFGSSNTKFIVSDLSSTNGTFVKKEKFSNGDKEIPSGETIRFGKTTIRILSNHHKIPKTKIFSFGTKLHDLMDNEYVAAISLTFIMLSIAIMEFTYGHPQSYLNDYKYIESMFAGLIIALGLSAFFKFGSYFDKSKKTFSLCISYTCISLLIIIIIFLVMIPYINFYLLTRSSELFFNISMISIFVIFLSFFWSYISNDKLLSKKNIAGISIFIITISILNLKDIVLFSSTPNYPGVIVDAPIPSSNLLTIDEFIKKSSNQFEKIENVN